MSGFTFFDTLLVFIAIIPILISLYAVLVSKRANEIAEQSDKKMTAIADSQIDEKLAMMAIYREAITITSELLPSALSYSANSFRKYHGLRHKVWNLDDMHKLHYDFNAVSDLNEYASDEKIEELIIYYIIPILKNLYSITKKYQTDMKSMKPEELKNKYLQRIKIEPDDLGEWNEILIDIANTAKTYGIETETIENIINELNAMRAKNEGV